MYVPPQWGLDVRGKFIDIKTSSEYFYLPLLVNIGQHSIAVKVTMR